ncbi:MAG: methylmalonyl-CoA mutase family protein [Nitriliruptoraceae bacterium]
MLVVTVVHTPLDARIHHRQIRAMRLAGWSVTFAAPFTATGTDPAAVVPGTVTRDLPRASGRRRVAGLRAARRLLAEEAADHDLVLLHDPELLLAVRGLADRHPVVLDVHEDLAATMLFSFASGPNYFMEIAKLRAARWLWRAVCKEWGVDEKQIQMYIHSRTASWNLTLYDPHVNMLRTTTETMSASLGGSDAITVHPFDNTYKEENAFSSRIARNTQLVLKEEAYFNKVADPAAGSYYIEQLTASIAEQAWKHFLETEDRGGYIEAFQKGWIQEQVSASAEVKRSKASSGRTSILGVNKYPAFAELVLNQGISLPVKKRYENATYPPLQPFSAAEEIEQLRLQTEKSKKRPKVFLLKYGEPAWMTARGMFAGSFFACAGYEIIDNRGFDSVEEGIAAAHKAKADIVVLCSADAAYPDTAPVVHEAMKGSAEVVIAGYPKDSVEQLRQQGVHHFIHVKSNLLEELQKFQSLLNINKA